MNGFAAVATTVGPSIGLGVIFYFVMRWVMRADRSERRHLAELDAEGRTAPAPVAGAISGGGGDDASGTDLANDTADMREREATSQNLRDETRNDTSA